MSFLRSFPYKSAAALCAAAAGMLLFDLALPQQTPLAFLLLYAVLACGFSPLACCPLYPAASAVFLSLQATLCCALQAAFLLLVAAVYKRLRRRAGAERILFAALAQLPYIFLFPHAGYTYFSLPAEAHKAVVAAGMLAGCVPAEYAVRAVTRRLFRCRLTGAEPVSLCLCWLIAGMGVGNAAGSLALAALSMCALALFSVLLGNSAAVPFSVALSLPLCAAEVSLLPLAVYAVFACVVLAVLPYGRPAAALALFAAYLARCLLTGLFAQDTLTIVFTLLAGVLPAAVCALLPASLIKRIRESLLFYRERVLPRIAVNRSRRAVGEQLYEVSALFREIESAFQTDVTNEGDEKKLLDALKKTFCANCSRQAACCEDDEPLVRLIRVGMAKGKVNLIDLPDALAKGCANAAGLLFALNKQLGEYTRYAAQENAAREGRRLLARQAHGVSEILKEIALEQSAEYPFAQGEAALERALQEHGILGSEIFTYGEDASFTVSMTLPDGCDAKRVCRIAGEALAIPLAIAERIPLTHGRMCLVLRRKPRYDAAFGIAARPKQGEIRSGDTHSVLRIDERRFLVALSDGMGSGENARDVSARTLSLLESFYKAKMPSETVLATVNSLIAFSADETFSCLDLAAVDLDTGEADLVKIGSPAAFLLSGDELKILEGASLPIGMLEAVHPATMRLTMKADDHLLFMSDGIPAAFGSTADLCAYLSGLKPVNPQALAENVLSAAIARAKGPDDDMTVLAVKLIAT